MDVSQRETFQALVIAAVVVMVDEAGDGLLQLAAQILSFENYTAFWPPLLKLFQVD